MIRMLTAAGAVATVLGFSATARAQPRLDFGDKGEFIVGADRLVPILAWEHNSTDMPNYPMNGVERITTSNDRTSLSFLWGQSIANSFYTIPRIGFDYVLMPNVTVGGELAFTTSIGGSRSMDTVMNGNTQTDKNDLNTGWGFGIAPRAGYVLAVNDVIAFWLRGGFSFYDAGSSSPSVPGQMSSSNSVNQFALDLEPQLVVTPVAHFGLTAGLLADIPIVGQTLLTNTTNGVSTSASASSSYWHVGLSLGMLGYF